MAAMGDSTLTRRLDFGGGRSLHPLDGAGAAHERGTAGDGPAVSETISSVDCVCAIEFTACNVAMLVDVSMRRVFTRSSFVSLAISSRVLSVDTHV